jgi:multisubunit Na+/H+ antiporter MnhB subunit
LRRQHGAGDAGAAFIQAIVFAVAKIALDVATRRDRQMDAAIFLVRILAETGMAAEINPGRVHR